MKRLNALLLVINVMLLACFLVLWIIPSVRLYAFDSRESAKLGMRPYMKRRPFTLLVSKEFPTIPSFMLGVEGTPILMTCTSEERLVTAEVWVGTEAKIGISFTGMKNPVIHHVGLLNNGTYYHDVGGNGTYEKILHLPDEDARQVSAKEGQTP